MAKSPRKQNQQMRITLAIAAVFMLFLLFHMLAKQPDEVPKIEYSQMLTDMEIPKGQSNARMAVAF